MSKFAENELHIKQYLEDIMCTRPINEPATTPNRLEVFFSHPKVKVTFVILEKVSLIALAVFAAYLSPKLFFPFFGAGILLGTYLYWNKKITWPIPGRECKHDIEEGCENDSKETCEHEHESGGCSQGFLEQLTGVRLPPPLALGANIAITVCHIEHHSAVFAPIIGLNAGMWVGSLLGSVLPDVCEKIRLCSQQALAHCR